MKFTNDHFTATDISSNYPVRRRNLYDDVLKLFSDEGVMEKCPLHIKFVEEMALDCGGVSRDMLSGFWEEAYGKLFDGCNLLTPVIHPQVDMQVFRIIGRILSHGYLVSGFLPVRIAFPTVACILLGPNVAISDNILLDTFPDCLSDCEASVVREAMTCTTAFGPALSHDLVDVLSRFGCREKPTQKNIFEVIVKVARYEFIAKPLAAVTMISTGVTILHASFWRNKTVEDLRKLYLALTATPRKVVGTMEADCKNPNEKRVWGYLQQYIWNMSGHKVRRFLRFVTGSSVCLASKITVVFNSISGFARRPISHTCSYILDLSSSYITYLDLVNEFDQILSLPEVSWSMDAV